MKEKILLCLCMLALMTAVAGCALAEKPAGKPETKEESRVSADRTEEPGTKDRITDGEPVTDLPILPETGEETGGAETPSVTSNTGTVPQTTAEIIPVKEPLVTRQPLQTVIRPNVVIPQPKLPETTARETAVPETKAPETTAPVTADPETTGTDVPVSDTAAPETGVYPETGTEPETTVPDVPETEPPETEPPETEPAPEPVRITVAKRPGGSENLIFHDFYIAGVGCSVVYENSDTVPYGQVISVEFSGKEDSDHYYVDYGTKATLHVSTASGGDLARYNDRIIYLTFDDGPCKYTGEVLDTLASYNVRATFFTVGFYVNKYPQQVRAIYKAGHALGCHSYSHEFKEVYRTNATMVQEIYRWEDAVAGVLGGMVPYKLFRFPGGTTTSFLNKYVKSYCKEDLGALGYLAFDWSMASNDAWFAGKPDGQTMEEWLKDSLITTLEGIEKWHPDRIRVCLMHETNKDTREMLPWALSYLSGKGYTFRTLDLANQNYFF